LGRPRRPVEPLVDRLIEGRFPKQIADELHVSHHQVNQHLARFVRESGCRHLWQAVALYVKKTTR
jgi:FixJ family two-component response regulator